jgi:hypothetical protein
MKAKTKENQWFWVVFFMSPASAPSYGGLIKLSD